MTSLPKFQFHKGTIRTNRLKNSIFDLSIFQFHKGTIRTIKARNENGRLLHFNSIKVQLEPCPIGLNDFTTQISIP